VDRVVSNAILTKDGEGGIGFEDRLRRLRVFIVAGISDPG